MSDITDEMIKETLLKTSRSIAIKMIEKGSFSLEEISDFTDLPIDEVKSLAASLSTKNQVTD